RGPRGPDRELEGEGPDGRPPASTARAAVGACVARSLARAAEARRAVVASVAVELDPDTDVAACVFASRGAEERYFVWEQPEREDFAIGALGAAVTIDGARGPDR